jgi:hypothetical protein
VPTLQIDHRVRDYDGWKQVFDGDPVGRQAGGVRSYRVSRLAADPNHVIVDLEFDTTAEADAFGERLRALWAEKGPRLGLESPTARTLEQVETHVY